MNRHTFASHARRSRQMVVQERFAIDGKRAAVTADATTVSISLPDAHSTRRLGAALASASAPGTVVLLRGPLGAGKTTLVDGFAQALGAGRATSPTFVIAHSYAGGRMPIWHVDLYRIDSGRDVADLDLAQYQSKDAVTLIEWPERGGDIWPDDALIVALSVAGTGRRAVLSGGGSYRQKVEETLRAASPPFGA